MAFDLPNFLNRPLHIGRGKARKRLFLAPMSKIGHAAFLNLIRGFGESGLLFTEMYGSRSLAANSNLQLFYKQPRQQTVCQIFGNEPDIMAAAAQKVESTGFFGVDINCGCSVAALCRRGCGAALLKDPDLAFKIVAQVRKAVTIPLFVKFRTGWEDDPDKAVYMARGFADAGADALTFHPRVAPDRRTRTPKWEYIGLVKQAVSIPVIGNGNIFSSADCEKMIMKTGCDGVAVGRLAMAKPWIFAEWTGGFKSAPDIFLTTALKFFDLCLEYMEPAMAMRRFNKFATYYAANFQFGHLLYANICKATDPASVRCALTEFLSSFPVVSEIPNISLLR